MYKPRCLFYQRLNEKNKLCKIKSFGVNVTDCLAGKVKTKTKVKTKQETHKLE